jgi:hypothetical protein
MTDQAAGAGFRQGKLQFSFSQKTTNLNFQYIRHRHLN